MSHETLGPAPNLDDRTDAVLLRARIEGAGGFVGFGTAVEFLVSDDDLHSGGTGPGASIDEVDLFVHLSLVPETESFACPIRIGPFMNVNDLAVDDVSVVTLLTGGVRIGVEPEIDVSASDSHRVSLYAHGAFGAGITAIDSDVFTETFDSTARTYLVEAGLRASFPRFTLGVGYVWRMLALDESDVSGGAFVEEAEYVFDGLRFALGARW